MNPENASCSTGSTGVCVTQLVNSDPVPRDILNQLPDVNFLLQFGFETFESKTLFSGYERFYGNVIEEWFVWYNNNNNLFGFSSFTILEATYRLAWFFTVVASSFSWYSIHQINFTLICLYLFIYFRSPPPLFMIIFLAVYTLIFLHVLIFPASFFLAISISTPVWHSSFDSLHPQSAPF